LKGREDKAGGACGVRGGFVLRRREALWRRVARCGFLWRGMSVGLFCAGAWGGVVGRGGDAR